LSEVNWRIETRFLIRPGETRTLLRRRLCGKDVTPVEVTGRRFPLPTTIWDGDEVYGGEGTVIIPASEVMWLEALESKYQLLDVGCWSDMV